MPTRPKSIAASLSLAAALWGSCALAAEPPYLRYMPTPMQVLEKTRSDDAYDMAARRYATFERLVAMQRDLEGARQFRGTVTPAERQLAKAYNTVGQRVAAQLLASLPPEQRTGQGSRYSRWIERAWHYEFDAGFNRQLMSTFFPAEFQTAYARAAAARSGDAARGGAMMEGRSADQVEAAGLFAEQVASLPPELRFLARRDTWVVILGVLFALAVARTLRTFRLEPGDPPRLRVGGRKYRLYRAAGTVTSVQRWNDHRVGTSSSTFTHYDGSQTTTHSNYLIVTKRMLIMIRTAAGQAQSIDLTNQDFTVAEGQAMAALWAIRGRQKQGPYVAFHNYDLRRTDCLNALGGALRISFKPILLLLPLLAFLGASWPMYAGALLAYTVLNRIVRGRRDAHFRKRLLPELLSGLQAPGERLVAPGGAMIEPA